MNKKSSRDNDERSDSLSSNVDKPDKNTFRGKAHRKLLNARKGKDKDEITNSSSNTPEEASEETSDKEEPNDEDDLGDEHVDRAEEEEKSGTKEPGEDSSELSSSLDGEKIDELERGAGVWKGKQKTIGQRYKKPDDL